jgi:hypothetical protein
MELVDSQSDGHEIPYFHGTINFITLFTNVEYWTQCLFLFSIIPRLCDFSSYTSFFEVGTCYL